MSSSAGATEDISTLSSETQPSKAGCKSALLRLHTGTRFGSAQALSLAKAHIHACHPCPLQNSKAGGLASYEPRFRPGPKMQERQVSGPIKTLQDKGNKLSHPEIAVLTTVDLDDFPCQIPSSFLLL